MAVETEGGIPKEPGFYWVDWYGSDAVVQIVKDDHTGKTGICAPGLAGNPSPHCFENWRGPIEPPKKAEND